MTEVKIDIINQADITLNINPGDTFTLALQNIQNFQNALGIIYIGDTQQRLGVLANGYYLFKLPSSGSTYKLTLGAGQTMSMGGENENKYSGEIQFIKSSGQSASTSFKAIIKALDKIQVIPAVPSEQHNYQFLGSLSVAPSTGLAQYQIYYDTVESAFFVCDGEEWVEVA